jgi:tetratricopeptide (TPR) repeat protein
LLLEFLARESRSARILIVVAYREMEIGKRHPLLQTLADLARGGLVERLSLGGLTESEVGQFIAMSTGRAAAGGLISSVYARTEGNPFFVSEVVKLLVSEGVLKEDAEVTRSVAQLPQGVRDVIGRRLDRLSPDCNRLLATAAVIGREFNADLLERVSGDNSERVFELLQEAVDARILSESARHPGEYAFGHALIREVLYEALGLNRRVRLHRTVGAAIEKAYEPDIEPHLPELAYHFLQCAPAGDVGKAINYAVRAAERATALLAYEEAAQYYERALEALDLQKSRDEKKRCELLLELGEAHKRAGNNLKARSTFEQAAEVARRAGGPELLARAALGFAVVVIGAVGLIDQLQIRLLTEALDALPNKDSGLRAQVLAHLSAAMYYSPAKREPMSLEAVEMARRVGDPVALVTALYCHHVALMLTEDLQTRRAAALEMLQVAEAAGLREMELRALYRLTVDAMELGDMCALDEAIENYARSAQALKQPAYLWLAPFFRGSRALLKGDFAECERLGKEALGIAQKIQSVAALLFVGVQMSVVRVEQGRAEEQLEATMRNLEQFPMIPGNRAILAYLYAHLDRTEDASRTMREMTANDFAALPRDGSWIVVLSALSYVCWIVRDAQTAEQIYPRLLPYHGRNIVSGNSGVGVGSVWRPLGLLAASMGRWSEAISHFEAAIAMNESMGARPAKAGAQVDLAESLYERNMPGDRSRAAELLDVAAAQAEELGQGAVQERIRRARLQGIGKI